MSGRHPSREDSTTASLATDAAVAPPSRRPKRSAAEAGFSINAIPEQNGTNGNAKKIKEDLHELEKQRAKHYFSRWIRKVPYPPYRDHIYRERYSIPHLLGHLRHHPSLRGLRFQNRHSKKISILAAFLMVQADLETIRQVFAMTKYDRFSDAKSSALLTACKYGANEDVIRFLLEKLPCSAKAATKEGKNALEFVLESNRSTESKSEIVSLLLATRPTLIMHGTDNHGKRHREDIFHRALRSEYGDAITALIFNNLAELMRQGQAVKYFSLYPSNSFFYVRQVTALSMVLPHLTKLDCMPHGWSYEGYRLFLVNLRQTRNLKFLSLTMPTHRFSNDGGGMSRALQRAINNSRLVRIAMMAISRTDSGHEECFQAIVDAVACTARISHLRLEGFSLPRSEPLTELVSGRNELKSLHLENISVDGPWRYNSHREPSKLETLDIRNCNLGSAAFKGLVSQTCEMPKLERLRLEANQRYGPFYDGTKSLAALLRQSKLRFLSLNSIGINNWKEFTDLLKKDKTLERLSIFTKIETEGKLASECLAEALDCGNTSLQHAVVVSPQPITFRIDYLTALNRAGRALAAREQSLTEFIDLLGDVTNQRTGHGPSSELNMMYGLLMLSPALWSSESATIAV